MTPPNDPSDKLNAQIRRITEASQMSRMLDTISCAAAAGPLIGLPPHVRDMVEGKGPYAGLLDTARHAIHSPGQMPAMSETMRQIFAARSPLLGTFGIMQKAAAYAATRPIQDTFRAFAEAQAPLLGTLATLTKAAEAAAASFPIQNTLRTFAESNAYTGYLDSVRSAVAFAAQPAVQDALSRATNELPAWLKPVTASDMLLPSWQLTAGMGAAGAARPGLIRDVLEVLHRERPDTVAFDVAVTIAETFDEAGDVGAEKTADLLEKYAEALIKLYASTRDWVIKRGIYNTMMLILGIAGVYYAREAYVESHLARLDADEQTALARAAASPEPTPAQQEISRQIQAIDKTLREQRAARAAERDERVVIRSAPLRVEPDVKATAIRIVYPEDRVRVLDRKDRWARVELFDYKSEATVTGWIRRDALRVPAGG